MFNNGDLVTVGKSGTIYRVARRDPSTGRITAQILRTKRPRPGWFNRVVELKRPELCRPIKT